MEGSPVGGKGRTGAREGRESDRELDVERAMVRF